MSINAEPTAGAQSTLRVNSTVEVDPVFWRDTIDKSTAPRNGASANKRRKVSPPPLAPATENDRAGRSILLVHRVVSLDIAHQDSYSKLVDGLDDYPQHTISVGVDCNISVRRRLDDSPPPSFKIYPSGETTVLLEFPFTPSDLTSEAQEDAYWVAEVLKDSRRVASPLKTIQSRNFLTLTRDPHERWSFVLSMQVTMDATEDWSVGCITHHGDKYCGLLAHALPVGKPIWGSDPISPRDFYLSVHVPDKTTEQVPDSVQCEELRCRLFPFQRRAVQWMLRREGVQLTGDNPSRLIPLSNPHHPHGFELPPTFFKQPDKSGKTCYVSHIQGIVSSDLQGILDSSLSVDRNTGILAEEMGLGKTVEVISLVCLHRRSPSTIGQLVWDARREKNLLVSGATLIITPPSILHQWESEIAAHAPDLKVLTYDGMKRGFGDPLEAMVQCDVVLTTYSVLSSEIHYAGGGSRGWLRRGINDDPLKDRSKSPLVKISWWRVCLDEAQMVERGVSNAATLARDIPRINAWCVTGTPVRKDINDCFGLLLFLRYEPLCLRAVWRNLLGFHPEAFRSVFGRLALRHSKDMVHDEIALPAQNRVVVTVPFSQVEEQNYQDLFVQMCEDIGVDLSGVPHNIYRDHCEVAGKMRKWLMRLRQTCLHPEVGERNRKAFGLKAARRLRTVEQVLAVMIDQHTTQIRANERTLFWSMVKRGQLEEHSKNIEQAMAIWKETLELVQASVLQCRQAVVDEIEKKDASGGTRMDLQKSEPGNDEAPEEKEEDDEKKLRVAGAKTRLKALLEVEHACYYWLGTGYYQLGEKANAEKAELGEGEAKGNGDAEQPGPQPDDSRRDKKTGGYKEKEAEYYDLAKKVRLELTHESRTRALKFISAISKKKEEQLFVEVPDIDPPEEGAGGIESRPILDAVEELADVLNNQVILFDEWRERLIAHLLEPLVDQDDDVELEGNELEVSAEKQEESYAYMSALRALLADREESFTEVHNSLIEQDMQTALAQPQKIHPDLFPQLFAEVKKNNPLDGHKSMKHLLNQLRMLINDLRQSEEAGNKRAQLERAVAEMEHKRLQKMATVQTKALSDSYREVEQFRSAYNARVEFYRQVQAVSDTVLPLDIKTEFRVEAVSDVVLAEIDRSEEELRKRISQGKSKTRYFVNLSGKKIEEKPACVICLDAYEIGVISNCGHSMCKACIIEWRKTTRTCPVCKARLRPADFFEVIYKPKDLAMQKEHRVNTTPQGSDPNSPKIFADVDDRVLREIKRIDLEGESYGSKIDMITRHLVWLKRNGPGFKAVIFSQWRDVLDVIKESLWRARVGFASLENGGIDKFRNDPEVSCFLLHAKSQSAGLTLVNATHVFFCEPLLNTGLELQACSRIHRIGQRNVTTIWVYVVANTVEKSVLELATRRRLALISQSNGDDTPVPDAVVDERMVAAESEELRNGLAKFVEKAPGGGEVVKDEDLWDCLFGKTVRGELVVHPAK